MKQLFNGVLVLEGSNDASYISSFMEVITVITNGYDIPKEEMDFLINLPDDKQIYLLTDSDSAGKQIRDKLHNLLPKVHDLYVDINRCNKNNKHGVAECDKEELLKVLSPYLINQEKKDNIAIVDLYKLGIDNKAKRDFIAKELHLGKCNNKILLKRINYLGIQLKELEKYGN